MLDHYEHTHVAVPYQSNESALNVFIISVINYFVTLLNTFVNLS